MSEVLGPAPKPCESCPYRRDVPSGVWSAHEYAKLARYDGPTWTQPTELFQCHQTDHDSARARLCAGWVACHGEELLALRIGAAIGTVNPAVLNYTTAVPVFASGTEAMLHGVAKINDPSDEACAMVAKIADKREDIEF